MRLDQLRDADRLSRILLEIYAANDLDDFRSRALQTVHSLFGGELACHNEIDLVNGDSLSALSTPIEDFLELRPAFFEHIEDHPSVQHHLKAEGTETSAVKTSDFVSQKRWRASALYQEFYKPLADVRYQVTIGQKIENRLIFFAVSRDHRDFSENDRTLLTLLRPHFIQAYQNALAQERLNELRSQNTNEQSEAGLHSDASVFALMQRFGLTRREAMAMLELATGKTNPEIAQTLGISLSTLKTRLERLFRKLGVRSRTAAALRILEGMQSVRLNPE